MLPDLPHHSCPRKFFAQHLKVSAEASEAPSPITKAARKNIDVNFLDKLIINYSLDYYSKYNFL
jgi:hypothetical protein